MKNFIKSIFSQSFFNSIKLGIKKGLEIPTLPLKIRKFYDHILIRVFRFIGGVCLVLNLTKLYLTFPEILRYFFLGMSVVQITQILVILLIKIIYSSYKLIYKPEEFEVRNSPLNLLATHLSKMKRNKFYEMFGISYNHCHGNDKYTLSNKVSC